ncbi:MAG: response regulator transcription factor [Dehalococcoidales bacterium]|nr:response regulator transcription factor [Dehalococcoidales bacterium]
MLRIAILAKENEPVTSLSSALAERGFTCSIISDTEKIAEAFTRRAPDVVLVTMANLPAGVEAAHLIQHIKPKRCLPVIALISREMLDSLDFSQGTSDFVVEPWEISEVIARIKRGLWLTNNIKGEGLIKHGDLVIDVARCEVSLSGQLIPLTFKEYELLKLLASSQGKVFTRDNLLNRLWGYDYYGGDRTVDVHIRRLRSKIEDPTHTFIDTVRNIGYKFRIEA